ncbi:MAG: CRISPR-associated endonuclease Cas1 [Anaerolineae bacterium]|nr:CRISPR-associated endonuclease Cas1 [Anaerolineae bacterium]
MSIITHLIVEERGAFISKYQGRLHVKKGKEVLQRVPLMHLEQVIVCGRAVSFSTDAVEACAEAGIPIHFVGFNGTPYASLYAAGLTGTVQTRRAQMLAYQDRRGVLLAVAIASAKIENQAALLRYMAKYRKETEPALFEELRRLALEVEDHLTGLDKLTEMVCVDACRSDLLGLEGRAAQKYWQGVKQVVQVGPEWPGRKGRGAKDPVNSALNYGYGLLYGQIERAIVLAGLDPYAGFIHADRPGKPSLVLDLIEPFRQPVVDRTVFALLNKGTVLEQDEQGRLVEATRQTLIAKIFERLEKPEKYNGQKVPLRLIIQNQARHLATFVRGDRASYEGFKVKW